MKSHRDKKCLYNRKSIKGIKITGYTGIELVYKVSDNA